MEQGLIVIAAYLNRDLSGLFSKIRYKTNKPTVIIYVKIGKNSA